MELSKLKTSDCLYNPKEIGFVQDLQNIPEFNPRLKPPVDQKMLYTYIVLMYDKKSPLKDLFPNFWHRKRVAAVAAGFKMTSGVFEDLVEGMLLGQDTNINRMVIRYCLLFHEPDYVALVSNYEMFIQETNTAIAPSDPDVKKKIAANIKFLNNEISSLTSTIFGGDESSQLKKELYKTATSEILRLRPELIAENLEEDESNDDNVESVYEDDEDTEQYR